MTPEHPSDALRVVASWGAWVDEGQGHVLLAIHGLPGSVRDFRWMAGALEGRFRMIRVDIPGFGRAPAQWSPSIPDTVAYVDSVLETLVEPDAKVFVAGHSFGSVFASAYAGERPERVAGLVMLAPLGLREHRGFKQFPDPRLLMAGLRVPVAGRLLEARLIEGFKSFGFKGVTAREVRRTMEILSKFRFPEQRARASRVSAPTFVAWTGDDRVIESEIVEELQRALPDGPRIAFESGGHNLQKTRAVELVDELDDWMKSVTRSA